MISSHARARAAVRRLRTGIVPEWEIDALSVAYHSVESTVSEGFRSLRERAATKPLFVLGDWGTGKTHLLTYLRTVAARSNTASAWVDLNARSAALNYPQRFYPVVAETFKAGDEIGLKAALAKVLRDSDMRYALQKAGHLNDFEIPVRCLVRAAHDSGFADLSDHWSWRYLLGGDISSFDYTYKRRQATARLGALGALSRAMGLGGLVLLFDEAETIDQLWNIRSRLSAYSVLGRLCRMRDLWCVFGITERFERTLKADLSRGAIESNLADEHATWFLQSWGTNRFIVTIPPIMDLKRAKELAHAVESIYEMAYGPVPRQLLPTCVDEWHRDPMRNPRRLIRLLVHRMDLARAREETLKSRSHSILRSVTQAGLPGTALQPRSPHE